MWSVYIRAIYKKNYTITLQFWVGLAVNEGGLQWDEAEPSTFENFKNHNRRTSLDPSEGTGTQIVTRHLNNAFGCFRA